MSSSESIDCERHGQRATAYVCQHLVAGENQGFHWGEDPDNPFSPVPDAWCHACEEELLREGEWNDRNEAFADIKVICSECYVEVRSRNWPHDERAFQTLATEASDALTRKQQSLWSRYKLDECDRWDWDRDTGNLVFSQDGQARITADICFTGSDSDANGSWLWAWGNSSFSEGERAALAPVRDLGRELGLLKLAGAYWHTSDADDGWLMTAFAAKVLDAIGAYRTPTDHGHLYMVIRSVSTV